MKTYEIQKKKVPKKNKNHSLKTKPSQVSGKLHLQLAEARGDTNESRSLTK